MQHRSCFSRRLSPAPTCSEARTAEEAVLREGVLGDNEATRGPWWRRTSAHAFGTEPLWSPTSNGPSASRRGSGSPRRVGCCLARHRHGRSALGLTQSPPRCGNPDLISDAALSDMHHTDASGYAVGKCYRSEVLAAGLNDKTNHRAFVRFQDVTFDEELVYRRVKERVVHYIVYMAVYVIIHPSCRDARKCRECGR